MRTQPEKLSIHRQKKIINRIKKYIKGVNEKADRLSSVIFLIHNAMVDKTKAEEAAGKSMTRR